MKQNLFTHAGDLFNTFFARNNFSMPTFNDYIILVKVNEGIIKMYMIQRHAWIPRCFNKYCSAVCLVCGLVSVYLSAALHTF